MSLLLCHQFVPKHAVMEKCSSLLATMEIQPLEMAVRLHALLKPATPVLVAAHLLQALAPQYVVMERKWEVKPAMMAPLHLEMGALQLAQLKLDILVLVEALLHLAHAQQSVVTVKRWEAKDAMMETLHLVMDAHPLVQ